MICCSTHVINKNTDTKSDTKTDNENDNETENENDNENDNETDYKYTNGKLYKWSVVPSSEWC